MKKRDGYLDVCRGLAVISIIWLHTIYHSGSLYIPDNSLLKTIGLLFDVPFFMFLSGWSYFFKPHIKNVLHSVLRIWATWIGFIVSIDIIYYAFLLKRGDNWNTIGFIQQLFYQTQMSGLIPRLKVLNDSLWYMPVYSTVVLLGSIILTVANKVCLSMKEYCVLLGIIMFALLYINAGIVDKVFLFDQMTWFYLFFFLLGFIVRKYEIKIKKFRYLVYMEVIILLLWWCISRCLCISARDLQGSKFPPNLMYLCCSLIMILIAIYIRDKVLDGWIDALRGIRFLGRNSIFFYFSQGIGGSLLFMIQSRFVMGWHVKVVVLFLINLCVSLIIGFVFMKFYKLLTGYLSKIFNFFRRRSDSWISYKNPD